MNLEETKKKETVRISKKDLLKLLSENEQMSKQITELQTRMNELVEENRQIKQQVQEPSDWENAPEDWGPGPGRAPDPNSPLPDYEPKELSKEDIEELLKPQPRTRPSYPSFRRDVYFDGSNNR